MADEKVSNFTVLPAAGLNLDDRFGIARPPFTPADNFRVTTQQTFDAINKLSAATLLTTSLAAFIEDPGAGTPTAKKSSLQEIYNSISILGAAGAPNVADLFVTIQAGLARRQTLQGLFNSITALAAAGAPNVADAYVKTQGGVAVEHTLQELFDGASALADVTAAAPADKLILSQAGVAKEIEIRNLPWLNLEGESWIIIGTRATTALNGQQLIDAYAHAKTRSPYGAAKSRTNRYTIICLPETYDVTATAGGLTMNADFIDVVGWTQYYTRAGTISSIDTLAGKPKIFSTGTAITHTSGFNDMMLAGLAVETSAAVTTTPAITTTGSGFPAAWTCIDCNFIGSGGVSSRGHPRNKDFDGFWLNCTVSGNGTTNFGSGGFGETDGTVVRFCPGVFINCLSGHNSFGADCQASGFFYNCKAGGGSFGCRILSATTGGSGAMANGTFVNCGVRRLESAASGLMFGAANRASGLFIDCDATGLSGFGANSPQVAASGATGNFIRCRGGNFSFGSVAAGGVTAGFSGTAIHCDGGRNCYGSGLDGVAAGLFSGLAVFCYGLETCFASSGLGVSSSVANSFNGTALLCRAAFGSFSGGSQNSIGASAVLVHCTAGDYSFAGHNATGGGGSIAAGALLVHCRAGILSFAAGGFGDNPTNAGTNINCVGGNGSFCGTPDTAHAASQGGTCSGTFIHCVGGVGSFAGTASNSAAGTCSGTFTQCTGGNGSFAGATGGSAAANAGTCSGTFTHCVGGNGSFSGSNRPDTGNAGTCSSASRFRWCRGGSGSFSGRTGGLTTCAAGTCDGDFEYCSGDTACWSGNDSSATAVSGTIGAGARFYCCRGGATCFGGVGVAGATNGTFNVGTKFLFCDAGANSFGSRPDIPGGSLANLALFRGIVKGTRFETRWNVRFDGRLFDSEIITADQTHDCLVVATGAIIVRCSLVVANAGAPTGLALRAATGTPTVILTHSGMNQSIDPAIIASITTPYNVVDSAFVL